MKVLKVGSRGILKFSDGSSVLLDPFSEDDFLFVSSTPDEDTIKLHFIKELLDISKEVEEVNRVSKLKSNHIELVDNTFQFKHRPGVVVPMNIAEEIIKAEEKGDTDKVESYKNFWTLLSKNPNIEARENLLWFLNHHGFTILKSGLFVTYRNVVKKSCKGGFTDEQYKYLNQEYIKIKGWKKSPKKYQVIKSDNGIKVVKYTKVNNSYTYGDLDSIIKSDTSNVTYTDKRTEKMDIILGIPVNIPREHCDEDSSNECSRGLHLSHRGWGELCSFGNVTLMCLCNPANVVAVPTNSGYNKIRTCEYFPVCEYKKGDKESELLGRSELDYYSVVYDGVFYPGSNGYFEVNTEVNLKNEELKLDMDNVLEELSKKFN